jgi:hypothetical protein
MTATLNGARVTACRVQIPAWGAWFATVEADTKTTIADGAAVTLVLEDLTLRGTVLSGGAVEARTVYRIVGGAGGWGRSIGATSYTNDAGVKRSTIVTDAATACGETMGAIPAGTVGSSFVRGEGIASRVLDELYPEGWYVDEAGVTQIGRRSAVTYTGGATRTEVDEARGCIELAPSAIATLLPGAIVDGLEAVDVEHVLEGKLRTFVYGARPGRTGNPTASAIFRYVDARTAHHRFYAPWRYRVVQRSGERYDLQAVRVSSGMPDLRRVRVRPGVAGMRARPKTGSIVIVSFVDGDPSDPVITACDDFESPGFVADDIYLQAGSTGSNAGAIEHATSAEALVNFVFQVLSVLATPLGGPTAVSGAIATALGLMVTAPPSIATFKTALDAALAAKTANTTGNTPGIGWPHVRGG